MSYQPYTSDSTLEGQKRARNAMRLKLWNEEIDVHAFLCHPDGKACSDGCNVSGVPLRIFFYRSELES